MPPMTRRCSAQFRNSIRWQWPRCSPHSRIASTSSSTTTKSTAPHSPPSAVWSRSCKASSTPCTRRKAARRCRRPESVVSSMEAFYLPTERGQRFCLLHTAAPEVPARGALLYVHPFGEEMNKSRRMAALQARAFAQAGWDVMQIDLYGCGDSSGEFRDASWDLWLADVRAAWDWLEQRAQQAVWLWGLRAGCLLTDAAARLRGSPARLLLWQPVLSGQRFLQQFLRTRVTGAAMDGGARSSIGALREALSR